MFRGDQFMNTKFWVPKGKQRPGASFPGDRKEKLTGKRDLCRTAPARDAEIGSGATSMSLVGPQRKRFTKERGGEVFSMGRS